MVLHINNIAPLSRKKDTWINLFVRYFSVQFDFNLFIIIHFAEQKKLNRLGVDSEI